METKESVRRCTAAFGILEGAVAYMGKRRTRYGEEEEVRLPYLGKVANIGQLIGTAGLITKYGGTEDEALAALVHDLVRRMNGGEALRCVRERLGDGVADITLQCMTLTERDIGSTWRSRKEDLLARLRVATPSALLIEGASRLHYLEMTLAEHRVVGKELWKRRKGGSAGTLWFHQELLRTLQASPHSARWSGLLDELSEAIDELEERIALEERMVA